MVVVFGVAVFDGDLRRDVPAFLEGFDDESGAFLFVVHSTSQAVMNGDARNSAVQHHVSEDDR